jgi:AcrR family transcriptional regulator
VAFADEPTTDRRVRRTRALLHDALASFLREKDYDAIVVKEILDRANVGRSTFYAHFRDKDDLLVSSIRDLLGSPGVKTSPPAPAGKSYERLLWFSLPIFAHVERHLRSGRAKMGSRGRAILHEHLRRVLADLIAGHAERSRPRRRKPGGGIPPALLVEFVASTFVLVLNWWVDGSTLSASAVNDLFRSLVVPTLSAEWE